MKKREVGPPLRDIKDEQALHAIWEALEADPMWLANRLRAGIASNAEQVVAAGLIEGKIKPRRPRRDAERQQRRLEVAETFSVLEKVYPDWRKKAVRRTVIEAFEKSISDRHVGDVRAEFDLAQIKRIREARPKKVLSTRQKTRVFDGKPMEITQEEAVTNFGAQDVDHDTLVEIVNKLLAQNDRDTIQAIFTKMLPRIAKTLGLEQVKEILARK
ncbi:MAG: hypothetical protein WAK55_01345 [Xanthobacteraceae bacterium]